MARMDSFLRLVVDQQASDLHFHAGTVPVIRYDNDLVRLPFRELSESESRRFIMEILTSEQRNQFEEDKELDFIYILDGVGRFRTNLFLQRNGVSAVFRIIPNRLPTIEELQLPLSVKKLARLANGLVLVSGPTGCGKTTTLAAIVNEINRLHQRHVITIEDPIEFVHKSNRSVITQRQVGEHTSSFKAALRSALRESPDVLVVGELRDVETISLALTAAETGVLVFGTLHTNSAPKAVNRMIDALPEESRDQMRGILSVLLRCVIAQRLCKRESGEGMIAVLEILMQNWGISNMIRENKTHQLTGYLQSANYETTGMQSLETAIFYAIRDGFISLEEGMKTSNYPEIVQDLCNALEEEE